MKMLHNRDGDPISWKTWGERFKGMMRTMAARLCVVVLVWGSVAGMAWAEMPDTGIAQSLPLVPLTVETRTGDVVLQVQVADTDSRRQTGLMFRKSMPETEGMLFIFQETRFVSFWMKNTFIPLDLLFVDDDGTVTSIARDTTPFSLEPIPSEKPSRAVLEINAGASDRLGIDVGDHLRYAAFDQPSMPMPPARR
jgi:uncharacterized membrane protein (UPF0127 family)